MLFGFLVFAVVAAVGVFRRLPLAYGAYVVAALALPLSFPVEPAAADVAAALPRRPVPAVHVAGAWSARSGGPPSRSAAVSAIGLGLFAAQFATWHWIA